jgi:RNA polymerase sigma-70 factor, ECF subfamily
MRALARKLCRGGKMDAEDLVQDTLERALRQREWLQAQGEGTVRAWLCTTLRRRFLDWCRHRRVEAVDSLELERVRAPVVVREERDWEAWELVTGEELRQALERLSPRLRAAFELHMSGLRYKAIAQRLGVAPGTVGTRLYLARRELRTQLQGCLPAGEPQLESFRRAA